MNNSLISYNIEELEKKQILSEAKALYKSKIITEVQYSKIGEEIKSELYSPTIFIKILLFILSYIGMTTVIVPIGLLFSAVGETGYRILAVILGMSLILFTETVLIVGKNHYKSGITEAGIYSGTLFIMVGVLSFGANIEIGYLIMGFIFSSIITVRYLDLLALVVSMTCFSNLLYKIIHAIGGLTEAFMPFIFFFIFLLVFIACIAVEKKLTSFVFNNHLIIAKTLSLLVIYASVNYFVVRELSVNLMGLTLAKGQDIPFSFVFYILTALLPLLYIYYGVVKRSVLFLRVGLLIFTLSVITFKYYFSLGMPVITFTVSGIILIAVSLWLMNYLKVMRKGFTRENLINDKWMSQDLSAIIISQTLGGNKLMENKNESFGGGRSGGGGASSSW
jgi:hypothetical protein